MIHTARSRRFAILSTLLLTALLAACGGGDDEGDDFSAKKTTTSEEKATTTEADKTTTTGDGKATTTLDESSREQTGTGEWAETAAGVKGEVGSTHDFECPGGGTLGRVWGVNVYTDDSSVCTAAVHVGLITPEEGGTVTIKLLEGQDRYDGKTSNGVTSQRYGKWPGSFEFPSADKLETGSTIEWSTPANEYVGGTETTFTVTCPPKGAASSLWGTGTYTDDSSICTAGVHAGVIDLDKGGEVTFTLLPGEESYKGSEANGITSNDYGSWSGSFRIDS
jgi:hypothetical protein